MESLLRELAPKVLGAIVRRFGDFGAAEDAVQEALVAAAIAWPEQGMPENPRAWLVQVAARKMIDHVRAEVARRRREEALPVPEHVEGTEQDDTLLLLFMCCHPALTPTSAIALTLRAVGGLTTAEIANAFLVPEATMAQRISRAKRMIEESGVELAMPTEAERRARLGSVLHVLYLIFNEGYASSVGAQLQRTELAGEAIRIARKVCALLPDDCEVAGLLALMLLTDARRPARTGLHGELIPLGDQDRTRWDTALITEGVTLISATLARGAVGPYQLQAAIAAVHDEAPRTEDTDWLQILALYSLLERMADNPMVALSRAIAAAMVHGPRVGLDQVDIIAGDPRIAGHYRLDAVRAHLHEMAGERRLAVAHYLAAAGRTTSLPERTYLETQASRLGAQPTPGDST